jgi:cytochrome c oxidase subunit 3
VGIATISMTFAAFTSALVARQGTSVDWQHFRLPPILYFNTLVLLASSLTLESSRRRLARPGARPDGESGSLLWLRVTLGLGLAFLAGQVLAWRGLAAQGLYLATSPSSAFFYVFTALHGIHLLGGLGGLLYVSGRVAGSPGPQARTALGAASLYWHFMAVLWLYVLALLALRI